MPLRIAGGKHNHSIIKSSQETFLWLLGNGDIKHKYECQLFLIFELVTFTSPVITRWYLWSLWMVKKKFPNRLAVLITWILATSPVTSLRRHRRGSVLMKRTSIWSSSLHLGSINVPAWQSDHKWPNITSATWWIFIFSQSLITNLDSLVEFYRAMSQVHHLDISPGNYSSWPGRLCASSFPASSILNHNPHLWLQQLKPDLHLLLPTSCLPHPRRAINLFGIQLPRLHLWKKVDNEAFLLRILNLISEFN